jgi:hypothetical protein
MRRPSSDGELGGIFDTLTVALESGGAAAVARSLTAGPDRPRRRRDSYGHLANITRDNYH